MRRGYIVRRYSLVTEPAYPVEIAIPSNTGSRPSDLSELVKPNTKQPKTFAGMSEKRALVEDETPSTPGPNRSLTPIRVRTPKIAAILMLSSLQETVNIAPRIQGWMTQLLAAVGNDSDSYLQLFRSNLRHRITHRIGRKCWHQVLNKLSHLPIMNSLKIGKKYSV